MTEIELSADYKIILYTAVKYVHDFTGDIAEIRLLSEDGKRFDDAIYFHSDEKIIKELENANKIEQRSNEGLTGKVVQSGEAFFINNIWETDSFLIQSKFTDTLKKQGIQSILIVPLTAQNKKLGAFILLRTKKEEYYNSDDQFFLQELADRIALKIINSKLYNEKLLEVEERIHAENVLKEREALLNQILDILPTGVWLMNEKAEIIKGNKKALEIWGEAFFDKDRKKDEYISGGLIRVRN